MDWQLDASYLTVKSTDIFCDVSNFIKCMSTCVSAIFTKKDVFWDFLFASPLAKWGLLLKELMLPEN